MSGAPKPGLLIVANTTSQMRARLEEQYDLIFAPPGERGAFLDAHADRIIAVLTDGHLGLPAADMARLPRLAVIGCNGVGYDAIDVPATTKAGVVATHTPDVLNDEVANTAVLLWMATARRLVQNDAYVRAGRWPVEGSTPLTQAIQNQTVGIVGYGRIGQTIARRAQAFDARILYFARSPKDAPGTFCADLQDMAAQSDVLIVITPGGPATRNLVDARVMAALGPQGILINISRGSVVDEPALIAALQSGALGAAGLDVFANEPHVPKALIDMEQVVLTPHIGSATQATRAAMGDLVCDNLLSYLKDGTVLTPIPEHRELTPRSPAKGATQ